MTPGCSLTSETEANLTVGLSCWFLGSRLGLGQGRRGPQDEYNTNKEDFIKKDFEDKDIEEWFQIEIVQGETCYVCNLCGKGFEELDKLKKHLIYKHKDAIVVLASNAVRRE